MVHLVAHIVEGTYELVEKMVESEVNESSRPAAGLGQVLVWAGAAIGAFVLGSAVGSAYVTTDQTGNLDATQLLEGENLLLTAVAAAAGAIGGACVGLLIWALCVFAFARQG